MVEYPGFWVSLAMLIAGGFCGISSLYAIRDKDWVGALVLLGLSAGVLGYFFS